MKNDNKENFKKALTLLPFALIALFALAMFGLGITALIYCAVTYIAFGSAMVFLILFGVAILSIGIGLACVDGFIKYKKRFDDKNNPSAPKEEKTTVHKKKLTISFQTICFGVVILGAVFIIVSAGLGATSRDGWSKVTDSYMTDKGFYEETKSFEVKIDTTNPDRPINKITLDMKGKNVVIIYTDDEFITIKGYETFPSQLSVNYGAGTVRVFENNSPIIHDGTSKLLSFMFAENSVESQVRIYVPVHLKDAIQIVGDHVVAQN